MHIVGLAITEHAPIFEVAVPAEVFGINRPDLADPWYQLRICGPRRGAIPLAGGFSVDADATFEALESVDTVIVAACSNVHAAVHPALAAAVRAAFVRGARIASICSGAFVLAEAGVLDHRTATTHWMHAEELHRRYPAVKVNPLVLYEGDGRVFTSAGTAAGIDLCLELVRIDHGAAVANRLARRLVVAPHRAGGQAQYVDSPLPRADDSLGDVMDWAVGHLEQRLTLVDLAIQGGLSVRTLARRFRATTGTSPRQWLLAQRIRRAQELLETTDTSVERVSELVGFGSPASLRSHFARQLGITPSAYRQTFHTGRDARAIIAARATQVSGVVPTGGVR
jgi:transcriptional regulator GlxA family with amidase domain